MNKAKIDSIFLVSLYLLIGLGIVSFLITVLGLTGVLSGCITIIIYKIILALIVIIGLLSGGAIIKNSQ